MKASSILFLVVGAAVAPHSTLRIALADCLYQEDIMLWEGQTISQVSLECVDDGSYRALDLSCGPNGELIEVEGVHECLSSDINGAPHCVQCGPRGERGSAMCLATPDGPCPDGGPVLSENDS